MNIFLLFINRVFETMSLIISNEFYKIDLDQLRFLEINFPGKQEHAPWLMSEIKKDAEKEKSRVWQKLERLQAVKDKNCGVLRKIANAQQYLECIFACLMIPSNVECFIQQAKDLHQEILTLLDQIEAINKNHGHLDHLLKVLMNMIRDLVNVLDFARAEDIVNVLQHLDPHTMKGSKRIICTAQMLQWTRHGQVPRWTTSVQVPNDRWDISSDVKDYLKQSAERLYDDQAPLGALMNKISDCLDASGYTEFSSSMY